MRRSVFEVVQLPTPLFRSLAALGFVIMFFLVASLIEPGPGVAATGGGSPLEAAQPVSLGSMIGPQYSAYILDTPDGPRYTVYDAEGNVLVHRAAADEVYRQVPDYNIPDLTTSLGEVNELDLDPTF